MGGYLLIVAENQPQVCDYLARQFSGVAKVRVLLDRRRGERRQQTRPYEPERRRAERRRQPEAYRRSDWYVAVRRPTG
ncbi:MAG: hypothetical protein HYV92_05665 [Candidatus Rokubacteria bacterium]|nr:hypothetical protein [Candidatus Rokubacteria bacterium]MBI2543724.1 hypothetical protein [Candidatus Rokubacteria bacterium]MBI2553906.1 hypothetical protein [Candidatus Rokubacteria bacterium]